MIQNTFPLIGTSGYSYEDWRGFFYAEKLPKNKMLAFYAQHFNGVEINSSYYQIPSLQMMQRLAEKTPEDFEFIVKVNRETTHRRLENEAALSRLREALRPLQEAGKLKGLLAQFPYSFKNNEMNRRYLAETQKFCAGIPLFFEFRHNSWVHTAVPSFLKSLGAGYVNVDEPQLAGLLPPQQIVTSDYGYIRFHGRNKDKWWQGQGSERYDYLYSENELKGWTEQIKQIMRKTEKTYIFFNNHPRGQAIQNARQQKTLLLRLQKEI